MSAGQSLITLEAMKMEHSLSASRDTSVAKILVKPGDQVEQRAELLRFQEDS